MNRALIIESMFYSIQIENIIGFPVCLILDKLIRFFLPSFLLVFWPHPAIFQFTPGSAFRYNSWQGSWDNRWCQGSNSIPCEARTLAIVISLCPHVITSFRISISLKLRQLRMERWYSMQLLALHETQPGLIPGTRNVFLTTTRCYL